MYNLSLSLSLSPDKFVIVTTQRTEGAGITRESAQSYILRFNSCQREFCFVVSLIEGVERPESGSRFQISVARTPDQGRSTRLIPDKIVGHIQVR